MRLFIAVGVPPEIAGRLVPSTGKMDSGYATIKWVNPGNLHLTLKFLGDVDDGKVEEIRKRLDLVQFPKFEATLSGCGVFPSDKYVRVIWMGMERVLSALDYL